jgi:CRP-like cAMP-binding protein
MEIATFFKQHGINADILEAFMKEKLKTKSYDKGHILLPPEKNSLRIFYVEKGLVRLFYKKKDKDITHAFIGDNRFIVPVECIFWNQPSPFGIELLENCIITSLQYEDIKKAIEMVPEIERLEKLMLYDTVKNYSSMVRMLKFLSAKERYKLLLKEHPNILQRASLGHIASYLGISQQTLSVIRGQK